MGAVGGGDGGTESKGAGSIEGVVVGDVAAGVGGEAVGSVRVGVEVMGSVDGEEADSAVVFECGGPLLIETS